MVDAHSAPLGMGFRVNHWVIFFEYSISPGSFSKETGVFCIRLSSLQLVVEHVCTGSAAGNILADKQACQKIVSVKINNECPD